MSQCAVQDPNAVCYCKGQQAVGDDQACRSAEHTCRARGCSLCIAPSGDTNYKPAVASRGTIAAACVRPVLVSTAGRGLLAPLRFRTCDPQPMVGSWCAIEPTHFVQKLEDGAACFMSVDSCRACAAAQPLQLLQLAVIVADAFQCCSDVLYE